MQKWEYSSFETNGGNVDTVNGVQTRQRISEQDHLKKWGEDGWELVSFTVAPNGTYKFVFKREDHNLDNRVLNFHLNRNASTPYSIAIFKTPVLLRN